MTKALVFNAAGEKIHETEIDPITGLWLDPFTFEAGIAYTVGIGDTVSRPFTAGDPESPTAAYYARDVENDRA